LHKSDILLLIYILYLTEHINSLIVSCGYQATHLLPVFNGRLDLSQCRRISVGGYHLEAFMQRLLQLKYPGHFAAVSLNRAEVMIMKPSFLMRFFLNLSYFTRKCLISL
jgi:actin-related protein 5